MQKKGKRIINRRNLKCSFVGVLRDSFGCDKQTARSPFECLVCVSPFAFPKWAISEFSDPFFRSFLCIRFAVPMVRLLLTDRRYWKSAHHVVCSGRTHTHTHPCSRSHEYFWKLMNDVIGVGGWWIFAYDTIYGRMWRTNGWILFPYSADT